MSDRVVACFYSCYHSLFVKWAKITYHQYPPEVIEFVSNNSFTDAILKLKESAVRDQLYRDRASLKTVFFHYCRNTLLGHLANEKRRAQKDKQFAVYLASANEHTFAETDVEPSDDLYQKLMKAMDKMESGDRQIIRWRHLEERSNVEIAELLNISVPSATNRIYRCMQRLREILSETHNNI